MSIISLYRYFIIDSIAVFGWLIFAKVSALKPLLAAALTFAPADINI